MKKFILLLGLFGVIICLHAGQQGRSEVILKQDAYKLYQDRSEGSWMHSLHDRRKQGDDFLNNEELSELHEQQLMLQEAPSMKCNGNNSSSLMRGHQEDHNKLDEVKSPLSF